LRRMWFALLLAVAVATPAGAAPSWLGYTGLLLTPTADALNSQQWNIGYHHVSDSFNAAVVNFGIARGLEVGGVFYDPDSRFLDEEFTAQVKYRVLPETATGVGLAVGWWDVLDQIDSTPYGVVSKRLTDVGGRPLRIHAGIGGGILDGFFAGADWPITNNILLMAEYDTEDLNFGARFGLAQGWRIDVGIVSEEFGIGASYNASF
jgi:hypothetical protein